MKTRNITLSIPADLLRRANILAAQRDISVSRLMTEALSDIVTRENCYARAQRRHLAMLRRGLDLGTGGTASWSRESLHDR